MYVMRIQYQRFLFYDYMCLGPICFTVVRYHIPISCSCEPSLSLLIFCSGQKSSICVSGAEILRVSDVIRLMRYAKLPCAARGNKDVRK